IVVGAPGEGLDLQGEAALARGHRLQDLDPGGDDFGADAVAGNAGDAVRLHGRSLPTRAADSAMPAKLAAMLRRRSTSNRSPRTALRARAGPPAAAAPPPAGRA